MIYVDQADDLDIQALREANPGEPIVVRVPYPRPWALWLPNREQPFPRQNPGEGVQELPT